MSDPSKVFQALDHLAIPYERHDHPPVFTAEEAAEHWSDLSARRVKNLFLRNKKGDRHYLVILGVEKHADLRLLVRVIGDDRLSFASPERLKAHLGLTPGAVSPFGLLNDETGAVCVIIDEDLREADQLVFHPNVNTASVVISGTDFQRFLGSRRNTVRYVRLGA